jgi:hypothetical protein
MSTPITSKGRLFKDLFQVGLTKKLGMPTIKQRVKVYFKDNQREEVRRFSLNSKSVTLQEFIALLRECRNDVLGSVHWSQVLELSYQDDENDWVTVSSEMEWKEALEIQPLNSIMRLKVILLKSSCNSPSDNYHRIDIHKQIIAKKPYLKRTKPEDYVLGCMRHNPKPIPRKKIEKPVVKFKYLKKTPSEKYVLACMRKAVQKFVKVHKKKHQRSKGFTLTELCEFLNFPKKESKLKIQKKPWRRKKRKVIPSKYGNQVKLLAQMGFTDMKKCTELCEKFHGNLQLVVNSLLQ